MPMPLNGGLNWPVALLLLSLALYLLCHSLYLFISLSGDVLRDEDEHPIPGRNGTRRATIIRDLRFVMVVVGTVLLAVVVWAAWPVLQQARRFRPGLPHMGSAATASAT